jgi:hypothetical protein
MLFRAMLAFAGFFCIDGLSAQQAYMLIAHRGGVVDDSTQENSRGSIEKAIAAKYWMVEMDLRITKDSVLVINHDRSLKRYYNKDKLITELTWDEISPLRSSLGERVLKFDEALALCEGKIGVMIDNKLEGFDSSLFYRVVRLLDDHHLRRNALMIGTDESTEFFTGKIKLSCTRQQLEDNRKRSDYSPGNYYLFSDKISKEDADWASKNKILAVGVLNSFRFKKGDLDEVKEAALRLKSTGLKHFQIDSKYRHFFR